MEASQEEIAEAESELEKNLEDIEFKSMLSQEGDNLGALVKIRKLYGKR